MSEEYQFIYLPDDEAAKLLEAFRLYGTKRGRYTTVRDLDLTNVMTDMCISFYITRAYYEHQGGEGKPDIYEYALTCGEKLALVQCNVWSKPIFHYLDISALEILAVHGECTFTQQQIRQIITFFEDTGRNLMGAFRSKLREEHPERLSKSWNLKRIRRLMLQNQEAWDTEWPSKEMSEEYQFIYLQDDEAAKLLEAFRLYGTKKGHCTVKTLNLISAMTDMSKSFYITMAYIGHRGGEGKSDIHEYAMLCGEKLALVQCNVWRTPRFNHLSKLEITAVHGECTFTQQQIRQIITVYIDDSYDIRNAFWQKIEEEYPEKEWKDWNLERIRRLMLQNREAWDFDLLTKEYSFHIINRDLQTVLWNCICQYGNDYWNHREAILGYAMTDAQQRFWLTFCAQMPDGIKHMTEPDDYEYAIVTEKTAGVVLVWDTALYRIEIKKIKGEIPLTEQEICDAVNYYETFRRDWEESYEKKYGRIPEKPDDL